jgi:hypothetical protein
MRYKQRSTMLPKSKLNFLQFNLLVILLTVTSDHSKPNPTITRVALYMVQLTGVFFADPNLWFKKIFQA